MDNIEFNLNEVFRTIVSRMETEGAYDHTAYMNFIDEELEEKIGNGELDPDANTKNYVESLQLMWPEAEALLTKSADDGASVTDRGERLPDGFSVDDQS